MTIEILEVKTNRDLKAFVRFPLSLYKGNHYYVPSLFVDEMNTLRSDKNPAFADAKARYWLAYQDGKIVGRVAAIHVPKHEVKWGEKFMRFGWLDFIDDKQVVKALIDTVEGWAKELGLNGLHGPLGFTDLDREGMLIEGFDEVATLATYYNYPYYQNRLEELGYTKDVDWLEYEIILSDTHMEKIRKTAEIVSKKFDLRLFKGTKRELLKFAPQLFEVLEEAYRNLYGTVPLSDAQVKGYIDSYFGFAIPEFIPIVLDKNNRVVAFGITFPSFSEALQKSKGNLFPFGFIHFLRAMKKNERADLYLVGVRDEYRSLGVNSLLMVQVYDAFIKHGVKFVEGNPNLEDNIHVQTMWKYFENRLRKRRRCFVKHLA
jgi:GNAT superfamily N-acetyltransferase